MLILSDTRGCHYPRHESQKEKENKGQLLSGVLTPFCLGESAADFMDGPRGGEVGDGDFRGGDAHEGTCVFIPV
jgi:hypothetical protein